MAYGCFRAFPLQSSQWRLKGRKGTKEHQPLGLVIYLVCTLVLGSGASRQGDNKSSPPEQELTSSTRVGQGTRSQGSCVSGTSHARPSLIFTLSLQLSVEVSWFQLVPVLQACCLLHKALAILGSSQPGGGGPVRAVHHLSGDSGVLWSRAGHPLPLGEGSTVIADGNVQKIPTDNHKKDTVSGRLSCLAKATLREGQWQSHCLRNGFTLYPSPRVTLGKSPPCLGSVLFIVNEALEQSKNRKPPDKCYRLSLVARSCIAGPLWQLVRRLDMACNYSFKIYCFCGLELLT